MKKILYKSGKTANGINVISDVYKFYETTGLPLEDIIFLLKEKNAIPDWIDFYKNAKNAGMGHNRIISKLNESIKDIYTQDECLYIIENLNKIFTDNH